MTCLNPASGNNFAVYLTPELSCNVLPDNPVWTPIRETSGFATLGVDSTTIKELNSKRDITGFIRGRETPALEMATAMSIGSHDELFENALQGVWTAGSTAAGLSVTVDATAKTFSDGAATFVTSGVTVGMLVAFPSLTGENSKGVIVTAVTETLITASGATWLTDEASVATSLILGDYLKVGTTRRTYSVMGVIDIGSSQFEYHIVTGVEFHDYAGSVALNSAIEMTHTGTGRTYLPVTNDEPAGSTYDAATTTKPLSDLDCRVFTEDQKTRLATSIEFGFTGNVTPGGELGENGVAYLDYGEANNTLSVGSAYIDKTEFEDFRAGNVSTVDMIISNSEGSMSWSWHECFYQNAGPLVEGPSLINQTLEFQPIYNQPEDTSLTIQRIINP